MPDFRLETYWPYHTVPPKPDSKAIHMFTMPSAVMGILTLALFSEVALNMISRMWRLLIFTLYKNPQFTLVIPPDSHCWALFYASLVLSI